MEQPRILIVDDEEAICNACVQIFKQEGYDVESSLDGSSGLKKIDTFRPDIVFVDLKMPGIDGIEVLEEITKKDQEIVPIVITGYATIESAVESMKHGAFDFLPKPFTPDQLRMITKRAWEKRRIAVEAAHLKAEKERMRQNFIALISHEMRTPLVAVMQYLEVLTQGFAGNISPEQTKIANRMKIRLSELLMLIDRWLRLSRIEELKLKEGFKDFSLVPMINEIVDFFKTLGQEKNVKIMVDLKVNDARINGDEGMIKDVFTNLISNGIKYNRAGGMVSIELRGAEKFWVVDVTDTGVGISQEEIGHLGEEFYRVKREGNASGTGLGLAIVKKILDIHNGRLEIVSKVDQGSKFSVYLPSL